MADYISRIQDFDDWKLDPDLFHFLHSAWGPHSVDCFGSEHNAQLERFHSRFCVPKAEAFDTFTSNRKCVGLFP